MGQGINTQQPVVHAIHRKCSYTDFLVSGNSVAVGVIPKGSMKLRTNAHLVTAFDNTSASFLVGTSGTTNMFLAAGDIGELTTNNFATVTTGAGILTSDAAVIATMTHGTVPTTGVIHVVVEFMPPVMNKEADTAFDT